MQSIPSSSCLYYLSQFAIRLKSSILPRAVPQEDDEVGRSDGGGGRRDEGRFRSCWRFHSQIHVGAEWNGMRQGGHGHRTNTTQSPFAPLVFLLANPTVKQSCENPRLSFLPSEEEAFATTFTAAEHKGTSPLCSLALSRPVDSFLSKKFQSPRSSKGSRRECTNWRRRRRQIDSFLLLLRHLVRYSFLPTLVHS